MRKQYKDNEMYVVDGGFLNALIRMSIVLSSGERLSDGERRDMGNFLDAAVTGGGRVEGPIDLKE